MAPIVEVFHAISGAFASREEVGWESLGLVVPSAALLLELQQLHRLTARGVRIGTIAPADRAHRLDRVLIVYRTEADTPARAEQIPALTGLAAVGDEPQPLRAWVHQHHLAHRGGQELETPPPPALVTA